MSLIKKTYFAGSFTGKVIHIYQTPDTKDAKNDKLKKWLRQNTFEISLGQCYEIHGSNGAFCKINLKDIETGNRREIKQVLKNSAEKRRKGVKRPYTKIVQIKSQPSDREIPAELETALREMNYARTDYNESVNHAGF